LSISIQSNLYHSHNCCFPWCIVHFVRSLKKYHKNNAILYCICCSSKCHFTTFVIQKSWSWPKIFLEWSFLTLTRKSCNVSGMYNSGNLPTLEKCHYISGMSPRLGQANASEGCGGEGGLSCTARGMKTMLNCHHCFVSFHVEWLSLVSHHHCFTSLSSVRHLTVVWFGVIITVTVCCYFYFLLLLVHSNRSLPLSCPVKKVSAYASLDNELATWRVMIMRGVEAVTKRKMKTNMSLNQCRTLPNVMLHSKQWNCSYAHNIGEHDEENILNTKRVLFGLKHEVSMKQLSIKVYVGEKQDLHTDIKITFFICYFYISKWKIYCLNFFLVFLTLLILSCKHCSPVFIVLLLSL
jgi:hypothetical protein